MILVVLERKPWPAMLRTIYGDDERFKATYWSNYAGWYFTADGARRDADGYIWVMGRVDDVLNVSGHRLSTMEVESALVNHPKVAEAAVVGRPDEIKGEGICCFVTLKQGVTASDGLKDELKKHGYSRKGTEGVVGPMPPFGELIDHDQDVWKIIAWIRTVYGGPKEKRNW